MTFDVFVGHSFAFPPFQRDKSKQQPFNNRLE